LPLSLSLSLSLFSWIINRKIKQNSKAIETEVQVLLRMTILRRKRSQTRSMQIKTRTEKYDQRTQNSNFEVCDSMREENEMNLWCQRRYELLQRSPFRNAKTQKTSRRLERENAMCFVCVCARFYNEFFTEIFDYLN